MGFNNSRGGWRNHIGLPLLAFVLFGENDSYAEKILVSRDQFLTVRHQTEYLPGCSFGHGAGCGGELRDYRLSFSFAGRNYTWEQEDGCQPFILNICNGRFFVACSTTVHSGVHGLPPRFYASNAYGEFTLVARDDFPEEIAVQNLGISDASSKSAQERGKALDVANTWFRETVTSAVWMFLGDPDPHKLEDYFLQFQRTHFAGEPRCQ